jgi:hypothetical protein
MKNSLLTMISITPKDDSFTLHIGKHLFYMNHDLLASLSTVLEKDRIAEMADLQNPWEFDNWLLEGAADDRQREPNTKWELRKRLLLHIGNQKWHLTQDECLKLGNLCRSLVENQ